MPRGSEERELNAAAREALPSDVAFCQRDRRPPRRSRFTDRRTPPSAPVGDRIVFLSPV